MILKRYAGWILFSVSLYLVISGYLSVGPSSLPAAISAQAVSTPPPINPHPECPPNRERIIVYLDTHRWEDEEAGEGEEDDNPPKPYDIPFDEGEVETEGHLYPNYLLGVLIS